MGWLWFLGGLAPVLGLVQVGQQAMADRYAYLPMLGIYIALVWAGADLLRFRRLSRAVPIVLVCGALVACIATTRHQLGFWRNGEVLFGRAIAATDRNWTMHFALAEHLEHEGRPAEAFPHYEQAAHIQPTNPLLTLKLANVYAENGKLHEAVQIWRAARVQAGGASSHEVAEVANNLAWALATRPDPEPDDANTAIELALVAATRLRETPGRAQADDTLAAAYAAAGRFDRALQTARRALADARALGQHELAVEVERRIALYARGRPARSP